MLLACNSHYDLLEVCEAIRESIDKTGELSRLSEHSLLDIRDMARTAIAKAEGEKR
jgi:hypothetical protein